MNTRNISWEIVLAGLTFIAIGIYLSQQSSSMLTGDNNLEMEFRNGFPLPAPPSFPGSIVIDLENMESLQNLQDLNDEKLKKLESKLQNLDQLIKNRAHTQGVQESLKQNLQDVEEELQKIEDADFDVKLQNKKVFVKKDYNVKDSQWSEASPGVYVYKKSFPLGNLDKIQLNVAFGNVNVIGEDSDQAELTLRATGDIDNAADLIKQLSISEEIESDGLIEVQPFSGAVDNQINLEATLTVPTSLLTEVQTAGGHINAQNLLNKQILKTSGGHISLNSIEGETTVQTDGGHITGDQITGNSTLVTAGGHINLNDITGNVQVRTGGGHITVNESRGGVEAKTSGGNITVSTLQTDEPLELTTSAGNISLSVPQDFNADIQASGTTVELDKTLNFDGETTNKSIKGTLNGGGSPVVISCGYGKVSINSKQ